MGASDSKVPSADAGASSGVASGATSAGLKATIKCVLRTHTTKHARGATSLFERNMLAWRSTIDELGDDVAAKAHVSEIDPFLVHTARAPTKEETRELGDTEERKEILKDFGYLEARVPGRLIVAFAKLPGQLLRTLHTVKKFENSTEPGDRTEAQERAIELVNLYCADRLSKIDERYKESETTELRDRYGRSGEKRLEFAKKIYEIVGLPGVWTDKVVVDAEGLFRAIIGNYPTEEGYLNDDGTPKDFTMMLVAWWRANAFASAEELDAERARDEDEHKAKKGKQGMPSLTGLGIYDTLAAPLFVRDLTGEKIGASRSQSSPLIMILPVAPHSTP